MDRSSQRPRYADEDTRPTSRKELLGWYAYGLAAEIFAVCGVGSFLPVTLEQLARENGVLRADGVTPCIAPVAAVPEMAGRMVHGALGLVGRGVAAAAEVVGREEKQVCVVKLLGGDVNTASFAMYTFSLSVAVQALTLVSVSAIADHGEICFLVHFGEAVGCADDRVQVVTGSFCCFRLASLGHALACCSCSFFLGSSYWLLYLSLLALPVWVRLLCC